MSFAIVVVVVAVTLGGRRKKLKKDAARVRPLDVDATAGVAKNTRRQGLLRGAADAK